MIVAAAIRYAGHVFALPAPARHHDVIKLIREATGLYEGHMATQGFIDSERGFVDRRTALDIVLREKQPMHDPAIRANRLFSENLW